MTTGVILMLFCFSHFVLVLPQTLFFHNNFDETNTECADQHEIISDNIKAIEKELYEIERNIHGSTSSYIVQGSKGIKGDPGDQGPKGPKGSTGRQGPSGEVGQPGDQGLNGFPGRKGQPGDIGFSQTGPKGQKGDPGDTFFG